MILMHEPFADASLIAPNYLYFFGHVHANRTLMDEYPNCMCVSVERIDYRPVDLDLCIKRLKSNIKAVTQSSIYVKRPFCKRIAMLEKLKADVIVEGYKRPARRGRYEGALKVLLGSH